MRYKLLVCLPFLLWAACRSAQSAVIAEESVYYAPAVPPSSRYVIDARVDMERGILEGRELVTLENTSRDPISVVAFDWQAGKSSSLEVASGGGKLYPPQDTPGVEAKPPLFVRLGKPLASGAKAEFEVKFRLSEDVDKGINEASSSRWYPRLWWDGIGMHDSYSVKLDVPAGWVLAASGRLDPKTGRYEAPAAATFGIYLAKGMKTASRETDGVIITSVFTERGAKAAAVCLETAADAVRFYRNWLGFYPFPFLTIVPGGPGRWGGYPMSTGIVAIHGLETYVDGESPQHWRHITSHEIGHQYWGEWVLDTDRPAWLWIAMGIFADTEFMMARGFDRDRRMKWMGNYINAIPMYYDTTLDIPPAHEQQIRFDRNNTVIHSKGPAAIFALDSVLGRDLFLRIYKRCLRDYSGKGLGWREFQRMSEIESGQNLQWFFDAWVRMDQYLCYNVDSRNSRQQAGGAYRTDVRIKRLGTMLMPVPVKAIFEDGTEQTALTDRNQPISTLTFASRSKLRDVALDPDGRLAMVRQPVPQISAGAAAQLAYGWESRDAPRIYAAIRNEPVASANLWYRLGTELYDSDRLVEALDCFERVDGFEVDRLTRFAAKAWQGHLNDLLGNRVRALTCYRKALSLYTGTPMQHSQYGMVIDREWVETRLQTPFAWPK